MKPLPTLALLATLAATPHLQAETTGWLNWRGPAQTGASAEKNLPTDLKPGTELWTYDIQGAGTPVIADGNLYAFGFYGEKGEDTQEALLCLDATTGEKKWEARFSDYISDVVYNRYGVGAPIVDPETRNVYLQTSNGRCVGFTREGKQLWEISLIEEYGRLTFPNGRTGSPAVFGELVIFHCVTANWGLTGPAADRFYAFDKITGEPVWDSTPGIKPVDSSFAMPVFAKLDGHDVFYSGGGDGNVYGIDARTGKPLWRMPVSAGGVNGQVILLGDDKLVIAHGAENLDASTTGRMICIKIPTTYPKEPLVLGKEAELWRSDDITAFTSSPVLAAGKLFTTINTGELLCSDPETGKTLWRKKLAPDQIHASPVYGDGKLYIPFFDGHFYVVEPSDSGAEVLSEVKLAENCLGTPSIWAGKVYLFTKSKLHCWGDGARTSVRQTDQEEEMIGAGRDFKKLGEPITAEITQLQIIPNEFALKAGESETFRVFGIDQFGNRVKEVTPEKWEVFIPPTALVKASVDATFSGNTLTAGPDAKLSAGAFKATYNGLATTTRGRVVAGPGYSEDFEKIELSMKNEFDATEAVNFPPLPWLGARIKWYVLEKDGSKVLANRLDNVLFQRTMNFFGDVHESDYVLQADVATDGNRRIMSSVGLINQRYLITLVGNSQILEVSSNYERVSQSVKFKITPNTWYTLKTHVKAKPDGTGTVFAKVWPRDEEEPAAWTIEVPVKHCHPNGAPGVFAFSPQSQKRVYIDNIKLESAK